MRAQSLTRRLKTKFWQGNVVPTQFEAAYLSANKLRTQFVGIPAMKHTVMDDSIFQGGVSVGSIPWRTKTGLCSLAHWVGLDFKPCRGKRKTLTFMGTTSCDRKCTRTSVCIMVMVGAPGTTRSSGLWRNRYRGVNTTYTLNPRTCF